MSIAGIGKTENMSEKMLAHLRRVEKIYVVNKNVLQICSEDLEPEPIPFHQNGVELEVDELDWKLLTHRRARSPTASFAPCTTPSPLPLTRSEPPMTMAQLQRLVIPSLGSRRRSASPALIKKDIYCAFCKNNGEASFIYNSHKLKDDNDRILCPILREYECPNCHASGDHAHTLKYCPLSGTEALGVGSLRTARTSTGKKRMPRNFTAERLGRRPPPSQLLTADKFQKVIGPLL